MPEAYSENISDRLYDLYIPISTPNEIWKAPETKYNIERQGTDKFLIVKFLEFKILDSIPILDEEHELQVLVNRLRDLKVVLPAAFQVGELPSTWNDYRKNLLCIQKDFTVEKIMRHLRIDEEN